MKRKRLFILLLMLPGIAVLPCWAQQQQRKKVAVVLSGGGAKGMAHIGVLKVLERAGIPVDIVTGTSMGSIVGGLYSIGYTADQLDSLVRAQNWTYVLSDDENLRNQSLSKREKKNTYLFQRGISLKSKKKSASAGILRGKNLAVLFRNLTNGYNDSLDFYSLPRPFACVATDIVTNTEYDFHSGVLAEAMRASMAIPGAFSPVRKGRMMLVDGGLRNNYPADIARRMGADIIIGSTVQGTPKTADDLTNTAAILGQIVDVNCKNKYDENLSITDVPIRVNTKPYGAASFTREAIDTLIHRGEEEAMRHWDELMALKARIGIPADYQVSPIACQQPQSMEKKYLVSRFNFVGTTPEDEYFIRTKFRLKDGDSIDAAHAELIATSMRVDLYYEEADYEFARNHDGYTLTFKAGARETAQIQAGTRFDTEEMAAIQIGAEVPFHTKIPAVLDITVRLGRRVKARAEIVYTPVSFTKLRLAYEYAHNDMNIYSKGSKAFNHTFNHHAVSFTPLDFNLRNFNITMSACWDYYHHDDLLAGVQYLAAGDLQKLTDDHYYSYHFQTLYDSENDAYFPTRGARFHGGYGYYTDNFTGFDGHTGFSVLDAAWRMAFALSKRLTLQPMAYGRMLFGSEIPMVVANTIGGDFFGHYVDQQMPFAGLGHMELADNHFIGLRLKAQENIYKSVFLTAKVNAAVHANRLADLFSTTMLWGAQVGGYYKSMLGPLGASLGWNNRSDRLYFYINLGYEF